MNTFWKNAKKLEGTTLYTTKHKKPFDIIKVNEERLWIKNSKGNEDSYRRDLIEAGCQEILNGGEMTGKSMSGAGVADRTKPYCYPPAIAEAILKYEQRQA